MITQSNAILRILVLYLGLFSPFLNIYAGIIPPTGLPDLVEKVMPGVVNVSSVTVMNYALPGWEDYMRQFGMPEQRKQSSLGSGFIIDKDGFVLTNCHVVEHATEVYVNLQDKTQYRAKIIGKDQKLDIALLQVRDKNNKVPSNLSPVPMGDSDPVRIAETVFAVGNPFGLQHTVTAGIISAKNRSIGIGPFDNFLQTDASINPGNSGGPLFNLKGEVIGINSVIYSRTGQSGGLGFAIPVNEAKRILDNLKRYGRVPRPWLGVLGESISLSVQQYYNLPVSEGLIIYNLVEGAPADLAGVKQGDILISVANEKINDSNDIERILNRFKPKDSIQIKVQRGQKSMIINIMLKELPKLDQLPKGIV